MPVDSESQEMKMRSTSISQNASDLEWLLGYELSASTRHRRFVSLVMLSPENDREELDRLLKETVRDTDAFFSLDAVTVILMGETDSSGALKAVERYKSALSGRLDVRYSVSSFPSDGKVPGDLMHTAHRRLKKARTLDRDAVVTEG
jgi:hypothetical protein